MLLAYVNSRPHTVYNKNEGRKKNRREEKKTENTVDEKQNQNLKVITNEE